MKLSLFVLLHFTARKRRMIMVDYDVEYPTVKPVILPVAASTMLKVPILRGMAPSAHILVYYVREDGEIVADSIKIKMKSCLQNEVGSIFNLVLIIKPM